MNIGTASGQSGLPAKTIRYYEAIGLISPLRAGNGYRDYTHLDVHRLRFLQRSRRLGFSVEECRQLLALYQDKQRASADVKKLAEQKRAEIDQRIAELMQLRNTLGQLIASCSGDHRPDCPIISSLSEEEV